MGDDRQQSVSDPAEAGGTVVVTETGDGNFTQTVSVGGRHTLLSDEPESLGGDDCGPSPYDLLLTALGACTAMTLRLYAVRKGIPLADVSVTLRHDKIHAQDCETCETESGRIDRIERDIVLAGGLSDAERGLLMNIADRCPVHRTLRSEVRIDSRLSPI